MRRQFLLRFLLRVLGRLRSHFHLLLPSRRHFLLGSALPYVSRTPTCVASGKPFRVDKGGEGIVGVWRTFDPELFLILTSDGTAQIYGRKETCEEDRERNENRCVAMQPAGDAISIDCVMRWIEPIVAL